VPRHGNGDRLHLLLSPFDNRLLEADRIKDEGQVWYIPGILAAAGKYIRLEKRCPS
jgi:hypothetical protein